MNIKEDSRIGHPLFMCISLSLAQSHAMCIRTSCFSSTEVNLVLEQNVSDVY